MAAGALQEQPDGRRYTPVAFGMAWYPVAVLLAAHTTLTPCPAVPLVAIVLSGRFLIGRPRRVAMTPAAV